QYDVTTDYVSAHAQGVVFPLHYCQLIHRTNRRPAMPTLTDYKQFGGRHWETGSVHNFYAYRGYAAPHTGAPYSEAFLLGVSGGITVGYFKFAYEGYDPQCNIL